MATNQLGVQVSRFVAGALTQLGQLQRDCLAEVQRSVVIGSVLTGSQGVPVDTKLLIESYRWTNRGSGNQIFSSDCAYAAVIEYRDPNFWNPEGVWEKGDRPHTHAKKGQSGSVRMTIAGWPAIVSFYAANGSKQRISGTGPLSG